MFLHNIVFQTPISPNTLTSPLLKLCFSPGETVLLSHHYGRQQCWKISGRNISKNN